MKVLSLTQPWASLMGMRIKGEIVRFKCIETRDWYMDYRGELAIQAAKRMTDEDAAFADDIVAKFPTLKGYEWPRGVIISVVEVFACVKTKTVRDSAAIMGYTPNSWDWEELLGNFSPGRYATLTNLIRLVEPPVPFRGMPMLCANWEENENAKEASAVHAEPVRASNAVASSGSEALDGLFDAIRAREAEDK